AGGRMRGRRHAGVVARPAARRHGDRMERSADQDERHRGAPMTARRGALGALALLALVAIAAPFVAPHDPSERFADLPDAPPTPLRLFTADGQWCGLCFHPRRLVSRLERRFEADTASTVAVHLFSRGHLIADSGDPVAPLLLAGTDASGRDVFARLV